MASVQTESSRGRGVFRDMSLATVVNVSTNISATGIAALIPLVRHDLPMGGIEVGAVAAMPPLAAFCSVRLAPRVIGRVGPGNTIGISQLICALGAVILALSPSLGVFYAGLFVAGTGFAFVSPASNILSTALVRPGRRGLAMSIKQTGTTVGGIIAGLTLPAIGVATSWRVALLVPVAALLAVAAWGFATHARGSREPLVLTERTSKVHRNRLGIYGFLMSGVQLTLFGYAAVYLVDDIGMTPQAAGVGLAVAMTTGSVGRLAWGSISDRARSRLRVLHLVAAISAVVLVFFPLAGGATVWVVLAALGVCSIGWNGVFHAVIAESAGSDGVARASSEILPYMFGGAIILPPLLGLLLDQTSWPTFWWIAAVAALAAALIRMEADAKPLRRSTILDSTRRKGGASWRQQSR